MNKTNICFDKVKKDCFKFIKSQETKTEKFSNKNKMLKSLNQILRGSVPFMIMMMISIVILCIFPEIVTWLPDKLMGPDAGF